MPMIILDLFLDNIFAFKDFHINFTYPKKIVRSTINAEHLKDRPNFRYKKVNIIMGANASGKTTLGKAMTAIFNFLLRDDTVGMIETIGNPARKASFSIDFILSDDTLYRVSYAMDTIMNDGVITGCEFIPSIMKAAIRKNDSYETACERLEEIDASDFSSITDKGFGWAFSYPHKRKILPFERISDDELVFDVLNAVLKTLDPSIVKVEKSAEIKNAFIVRKRNKDIIIQDGEIAMESALSSGTAEGIDVAMTLIRIIKGINHFYYCDEKFAYINSDIEQRIFGIMLSHLKENDQLFFTTHNTDMLDLNLPQHSYTFLKKEIYDGDNRITAVSASEYLKKYSDSVRRAVENDVFSSLPDETYLDEFERKYPEEK